MQLNLGAADLNRFLGEARGLTLEYEHGCFRAHCKLPVGGADLVAVPSFRGGTLTMSIPFSHIRGDLTGGFLKHLTSLAWGPIRDMLAGQVADALRVHGLPRDTVEIVQERDDDGEQVGVVRVFMHRVNGWLVLQPWMQPLALSVENMRFLERSVQVDMALKRR